MIGVLHNNPYWGHESSSIGAGSLPKRHIIGCFDNLDRKRIRLQLLGHILSTIKTCPRCVLCGVSKRGGRLQVAIQLLLSFCQFACKRSFEGGLVVGCCGTRTTSWRVWELEEPSSGRIRPFVPWGHQAQIEWNMIRGESGHGIQYKEDDGRGTIIDCNDKGE